MITFFLWIVMIHTVAKYAKTVACICEDNIMSYTGFTRINGTTIPYAINDGQMKLFTGIFPADIPDNTNEILGEYEDGTLGKCNLYVLSVPINNTEYII